jgi:hypothetical protein
LGALSSSSLTRTGLWGSRIRWGHLANRISLGERRDW